MSEEINKVLQSVAARSSKILGDFAQKQAQGLSATVRDEMGIAKAFMDLYARMAADPAAMASFSMNLWLDYTRLWQSSWMRMMGMDAGPVAVPDKCDARFKDECELLKPIIEGAGVLYVVDGSRPYGRQYEAEMEILSEAGLLTSPMDA